MQRQTAAQKALEERRQLSLNGGGRKSLLEVPRLIQGPRL